MPRAAWFFACSLGLLGLGVGLAACDDGTSTDSSTSSSASTGTGQMAGCTMPTAVPCSDEVILQMALKKTVTDGAVGTTLDGDSGFRSTIDASAGGLTPSESYTYARFGDAGLEKVDISDEDSLDSMDWDIAFRRYVLRINSGFSGPSCVTAARVPDKFGAYDDITTTPADLTYKVDDYFTPPDDCTLIPDGSGLMGSPATALSTYWTYPGCVAMSDFVYVIQLASGKRVKFQVQHYYSEAVQEECDTKGTLPSGASGAGSFEIRWAYLP